jgi:hypothetical protein
VSPRVLKANSPSNRIGHRATLGCLYGIGGSRARARGSLRAAALVLVSTVLLLGLLAPSVLAAQTRPHEGSFGAFTAPESLAVDQGSGDVYVLDSAAGTISRFDGEGNPVPFAVSTGYVSGNELIGTPNGAFALAGAGENQIAVAPPGSPAGTAGDLYVAEPGIGAIDAFSPSGEFLGVITETGEGGGGIAESCGLATDGTGNIYVGTYPGSVEKYVPTTDPPTNGDFDSRLTGLNGICNIAVSSGTLYASTYPEGPLTAYPLSSFPGAGGEASVEGTGTTVERGGASVRSTTAAIDPESGNLYVDEGDRISEFDDSLNTLGEFGSAQLSESAGIAFDDPAGVALASDRATGQVAIYGAVVTVPEAFTGAASDVVGGAATLNGTVDPAGEPLTECFFEYGETESYGHTASCEQPDFAEVGVGNGAVAVHARISDLEVGHFHFRLVATNVNGPASGQDQVVVIPGPPQILEESATPLYTTAHLEATIDPANSATTWHFEFGPTSAYGRSSAPQTIPAGEEPVKVRVNVGGLVESATYHYRVVAENTVQPVTGADQTLATTPRPAAAGCPNEPLREESPLDPITEVPFSTQLPDCRAAELVTGEKGPLAIAGEETNVFAAQLKYQVAPSGESVDFETSPGLPGASSGGEVIYGADRLEGGWRTAQLSPPILDTPGRMDGSNVPSVYLYVAPDLRCGIVASASRLTSDSPERSAEEGVANLYRRSVDGTYTLISDLFPANPTAYAFGTTTLGYYVVGASPDCSRIYFQTKYQYPGVGIGAKDPNGVELEELYEWDESASPRLRRVGAVPAETGEVEVPAEAGTEGNFLGAVSDDASRVVFTAKRETNGAVAGAEEKGREAIFVRAGDGRSVDVSQSETSTPDLEAVYQDANSSATRILFLANYGLTTDSSGGATSCNAGLGSPNGAGCDLYEYDLAASTGERLIDLSADHNVADTEGAAVAGVLGAAEDGSKVYFAARGQLVAGEGESYLANLSASTYNVYLSSDEVNGADRLAYVGSISGGEAGNMLVNLGSVSSENRVSSLLSRVTPSGDNLLFESSLAFDGYASGGAREAYLFSAATGRSTCVSCRHDGKEPLGEEEDRPLGTGYPRNDRAHPPLTLSVDGRRVFFESPDPLAPGSVAGEKNIYEWQEGTVHLLASGEPSAGNFRPLPGVEFVGAGESGNDVFMISRERLAPQDVDARKDLYDLRVVGGFRAEPAQPVPCDSLMEGACGSGMSSPPQLSSPQTTTFTGPANLASRHKKKHHKKKHRRHHRKTHHLGKKQKKRGKGRTSGGRRSGGRK